jgi:hypothetical protein
VRRRLDERFELLTRRRGAVERHRSLRTTVAWSYDLLNADEQLVFDRLSVFAGGFDLPAAMAVCGQGPLVGRVDAHIASLVERSLVNVVRGSIEVRYEMLETIRQYGEEQLELRGETLAMREQLLDHVVGWVTEADAGIRGPDELRWHHRLLAEWNNIRATMSWAIERDAGDAACALVWHLYRWATTRLRLELADWADEVAELDSARDHPLRPIVLATSAFLSQMKGDYVRAHEVLRSAVREERRLGESIEPVVSEVEGVVLLRYGLRVAVESSEAIRRRAGTDPYWNVVAAQRELIGLWLAAYDPEPTDHELLARVRPPQDLLHAAEHLGNPSLLARIEGVLGCIEYDQDPDRAMLLLEHGLATAVHVEADQVTSSIQPDLGRAYVRAGRALDALLFLAPTIRDHRRSGARGELLNVLVGTIEPLIALDEPRTAAVVEGWIAHRLREAPIVAAALIPASIDLQLRDALDTADLAELRHREHGMPIEGIVDLVLAAIDELAHPAPVAPRQSRPQEAEPDGAT